MKTRLAAIVALLAGVVLLALTAFISFFLYQAMHGLNGHSWNGGPEMTRLTIRLLGLLFAFSLNSILAGSFQLRFGHPNRVLAGMTLLLACALALTGYQVTQAGG